MICSTKTHYLPYDEHLTKAQARNFLIDVRQVLIDIRNGNVISGNAGICKNVEWTWFSKIRDGSVEPMYQSYRVQRWLKDSFESFGYDRIYPVEHEILKGNATNFLTRAILNIRHKRAVHWYHTSSKKKYNNFSVDGRFRIALLEKLIEKAKNDIENL